LGDRIRDERSKSLADSVSFMASVKPGIGFK
jgi:hypothetical protein